MVNKAEQPIEQPIENPVNTNVDVTEEFDSVDTPPEGTVDTPQLDPTTDQSSETTEATEGETSSTATPEVPETQTPAAEVPAVADPKDDLEKRIQEIEQQNFEYRTQQEQSELLQKRDAYRTQLESAGYLPEQAQQISNNWATQQSEVAKLQQENREKEKFLRGQANAALHFAKQYDLQLEDLSELQRYEDPTSMESAAKRIKIDRDKDKRIAELEAKLVPSQSFDDNQSTPAPSSDQDRWLDRYNQGDRSEQASAAARRASGLG